MKNLLEIGKIVTVFGIKGEVKVQPWCDSPEFLCQFDKLYYKSGTEVNVERSRAAKNMVVMKIEGIDSIEQAQTIRNRVLYMNRDDVELEKGCYFVQDLVGLKVIDTRLQKEYGTITEVFETGANDVYTVKADDGKLYYIPAIPDVIDRVDIDGGKMYITPLEGLFE
ncbi:MAG: ribosome maturation factor RimM [Oscillospiraceae bacterium]